LIFVENLYKLIDNRSCWSVTAHGCSLNSKPVLNFTSFRSSWFISFELPLCYVTMNWYDYFYLFSIAALPIQSLFPFLYFMVSNAPSTSV
jgi:hypothetical protein